MQENFKFHDVPKRLEESLISTWRTTWIYSLRVKQKVAKALKYRTAKNCRKTRQIKIKRIYSKNPKHWNVNQKLPSIIILLIDSPIYYLPEPTWPQPYTIQKWYLFLKTPYGIFTLQTKFYQLRLSNLIFLSVSAPLTFTI